MGHCGTLSLGRAVSVPCIADQHATVAIPSGGTTARVASVFAKCWGPRRDLHLFNSWFLLHDLNVFIGCDSSDGVSRRYQLLLRQQNGPHCSTRFPNVRDLSRRWATTGEPSIRKHALSSRGLVGTTGFEPATPCSQSNSDAIRLPGDLLEVPRRRRSTSPLIPAIDSLSPLLGARRGTNGEVIGQRAGSEEAGVWASLMRGDVSPRPRRTGRGNRIGTAGVRQHDA